MRNFMQNLNYRFGSFMMGRYGFDELSKSVIIASVICFLISYVPYLRFFYFIGFALILWSYIRLFSKNLDARRRELYAYFNFKNKLKSRISLKKRIWNERKTHKYFTCPKCKATLRVPKGKGKIAITCRECSHKMIKKS